MTDLRRIHEAYYDPDRHLPDEPRDRPSPHCSNCNARLPQLPDRMEPWEEGFDCSGEIRMVDQEYTEGLIDILGEDFRGKTYQVAVADCGVDMEPHAPHREITWAGVDEIRRCRACGEVNITREC